MSAVTNAEEVKTGSAWGGGRSPFSVEYGKLMMWIFLLSDAFTFSGLLAAYGSIRFSNSDNWPDPDVVFQSAPFIESGAPLVFVGIMTFILIMSSVTMVLAVEAGHRGSKQEVTKWMLWTVFGGILFLSCQAYEWAHLHHQGYWWGRIPTEHNVNFSNLFFTITGFHGFHVTTGVVINIVVLINVIKGTYERRGHYLMVEKVGLYWHFVDLVWVFVFTFFYLV